MTVTLSSQIIDLRQRIGDTDEDNQLYTADATGKTNDLYTYLVLAVTDFNEEQSPSYSILGTDKAQYYSPEPDETDTKLLCFYAARRIFKDEWIKASRVALSYGNAAGRENLIDLAKSLKLVLDDIVEEINILKPGYENIKDFGGGKSSFSDNSKKMEYGYVYCDYCGRLKTNCSCGRYT